MRGRSMRLLDQRRPDDGDFAELVAARSVALRRTAYLMCGDWHQAEDLVQVAFIKLHAAWGRVRRREHLAPDLADGALPDTVGQTDVPDADAVSNRDALVKALRALPPGQRAVL